MSKPIAQAFHEALVSVSLVDLALLMLATLAAVLLAP